MLTPPYVFVNCRCSDAGFVAERLTADLRRELGTDHVFFDSRTEQGGGRWPDELRQAVDGAAVVLVLIGKRWLAAQDEDCRRRLDLPDDWVRQEIAWALKTPNRTLPVLVEGVPLPRRQALHDVPDIVSLVDCQPIRLDLDRWEDDLEAIVQLVREKGVVGGPPKLGRPRRAPGFPSNLPAAPGAPFLGREALLESIGGRLDAIGQPRVLVLHGPSGVGKSELAREFARRARKRYPGGTFFVDLRADGPPIELARIGQAILRLACPPGLDLRAQCTAALARLADEPVLLVYDDVRDASAVRPWLPANGAPVHVLITSTCEDWDAAWDRVPVPTLDDRVALDLVAGLSSEELARSCGAKIVSAAEGLPMQICPSALALAGAAKRGRLAEFAADLTNKARACFAAPWARLDEHARLVVHAARLFDLDRAPREDLITLLVEATDKPPQTIADAIDACRGLRILEGCSELRLHGLWSAFVAEQALTPANEEHWRAVVGLQERLVAAARAADGRPASLENVARLLSFAISIDVWPDLERLDAAAVLAIGSALSQVGRFEAARP